MINRLGLDKLDKKILNLILEDARMSFRDIAKKVDVSVVTVMKRVRRLEKLRIINGYSALLDYEKVGFDITVIVEMRVAKGKLFQVESKISNHPNVVAVYDITGHFDALIIAKFSNRRSLDNFLKKIQAYEFVERTETKLVLNIMKEKYVKLG